jgi:hypothetical protein
LLKPTEDDDEGTRGEAATRTTNTMYNSDEGEEKDDAKLNGNDGGRERGRRGARGDAGIRFCILFFYG